MPVGGKPDSAKLRTAELTSYRRFRTARTRELLLAHWPAVKLLAWALGNDGRVEGRWVERLIAYAKTPHEHRVVSWVVARQPPFPHPAKTTVFATGYAVGGPPMLLTEGYSVIIPVSMAANSAYKVHCTDSLT